VVVLGALAAPKVWPLLTPDGTPRPVLLDSGKTSKAAGSTLKVSTYTVRATPFAETVTSTGTLRADEGVDLQAETNGKIIAINFTEGRHVKQNDLLVKLNDSDLRATLARATYRKELAQLRERRLAQLLSAKMVTQNDYDTALSDVNVQESEIDLARAQIEKTEIRAPFDGVVGLRYVSTGAYVNAATRIATVQRIDRLKIDFAIPEKYIGRIKVGSPVTFSVAGGEGRIKGEIYAFDPFIDTGTRTLLIRAICHNDAGRLLPGTFANVEMTLSEFRDAVLIPAEAVIPGVNEKNVFLVSDGKAERRMVETGTRTASTVHVLSGLKPGDVVITSGLQALRAGQSVAPLENSASDTSALDQLPAALSATKSPLAGPAAQL
jgi:membrane fusion protein (multidrug efflux system)